MSTSIVNVNVVHPHSDNWVSTDETRFQAEFPLQLEVLDKHLAHFKGQKQF